jgi:hypothetical protein
MPAHHTLEAYLDAYVSAAGVAPDKKGPLFRTAPGIDVGLTRNPMRTADVWRMIRRRLKQAGIETLAGCHSFRATSITCYLENRGTFEKAQAMGWRSVKGNMRNDLDMWINPLPDGGSEIHYRESVEPELPIRPLLARLIRPLVGRELRREINHFLERVRDHLSNQPASLEGFREEIR